MLAMDVRLRGLAGRRCAAVVPPRTSGRSATFRPSPQSANGRSGVQAAASSTGAQPAQQQTYDVYVNEPKPLAEGFEKHVVSVFVADEPGLINRVAGTFARRGANIESLAVGLTNDKALFTIVATGTALNIANLCKQLAKLVKVRVVEDITRVPRLEREMMLVKLRAPPGPARTEVLQLATIFRARVVDVAERTLTLCVSGDPGKCAALAKVMGKFGILEVVRTGRVCLKRGEQFFGKGGYSGAYDDPVQAASAPSASGVVIPAPVPAVGGVYAMSTEDDEGVWDVKDIMLDPAYVDGGRLNPTGVQTHTLSIEVQDVPGVLNQVTGVFSRRGYNVQSLAVGNSEKEGSSRICMVVPGSREQITKLIRQLEKLVWVQSVVDLTYKPFVNRELMLVKVRCSSSQRGELRDLVSIFRASIIDVSTNTMTVELLGKADKMKALSDLLEPYGILEIARTGRIAMPRESGVDNTYLEKMAVTRVF